jgi:hypothetical protein
MNTLYKVAQKPWAVGLSYVAMLIVNGLAGSSKVINGQNTAEVSNASAGLFTPAGFTFAIWGVIYLLLGLYVLHVLGLVGSKKPSLDVKRAEKLRGLFTLSSLINLAWIFAWQYEVFWLTIILMGGLLVTLIKMHTLVFDAKLSRRDVLLTRLPFSVYFGWISVATVANISTALVAWNWGRFGYSEVFWMIVTTIIATCIGLAVGLRRRDAAYLLVFVWAYIGIVARHLSDGTMGLDGAYPSVIVAVSVMLAVVASAAAPLLFTPANKR